MIKHLAVIAGMGVIVFGVCKFMFGISPVYGFAMIFVMDVVS